MKKIIILLFLLFVPTSSNAHDDHEAWDLARRWGEDSLD